MAISVPDRGRASAARLCAVQALYQVELGSADVEAALDTMLESGAQLGRAEDEHGEQGDDRMLDVDADLVRRIVTGAVAHDEMLDGMITGALAGGWTVDRLELLLRAILHAAAFELLERPEVPARVVINEYVDVAHAFFSRGEPGLVNAVLDRIARALRESEFRPNAGSAGG